VSPALDLARETSDYNISSWVDLFPTYAATAHIHKKNDKAFSKKSLQEVISEAENFACNSYVRLLNGGTLLSDKERKTIFSSMASFLGLDKDYHELHEGRVEIDKYARDLFKDEKKVCGLYDSSYLVDNPFPDRSYFSSPDPTLHTLDLVFTTGINYLLREKFKLQTTRNYTVLSEEVFHNFRVDWWRHCFQSLLHSMDDIRYGMALNPHLKVHISHGYFDMVTPYFNSKRFLFQSRLPAHLQKNASLSLYQGGHMFYTWEESKNRFYTDAKKLYVS
jgi:carboxypeptidase C (cathepsin A)